MYKKNKFVFISVGGLVALMIIGMLIGVLLDVSPEQIKEVNLIDNWMWYRITAYILVVALWKFICVYLTKQRSDSSAGSNEEGAKYDKNTQYLINQRWKIVVLFAFFEIVIIQQFGL